MNYCKVIMAGRLTRDPEVRYTPKGTIVATIGVACSRIYNNANGEKVEEALFIDASAFGKTGELIQKYFKKGHRILFDGYLKLDQWDDKQTGQKRSKHTIVIDTLQFVESKAQSDTDTSGEYDQTPRQQTRQPQRKSVPADEQDLDLPEDDIPF